MNFRHHLYRLFLISLLALTVTSCSIEKRRYSSGFHIEWNRPFHNYNNSETSIKPEIAAIDATAGSKEKLGTDILKTEEFLVTDVIAVHAPVEQHNVADNKKTTRIAKSESIQKQPSAPVEFESTHSKISAEVHPHAFGSLLCGIAASGSLLTMFILSFSPAALVAFLLLSVIVFSLLAIRLARSANSDMYYARHRYSGRGLASAGMVLGIVTLVALIGFIAVLGITVVFGAFA